MNVLGDLLYLGVAVALFALSFGLITGFDRLLNGDARADIHRNLRADSADLERKA